MGIREEDQEGERTLVDAEHEGVEVGAVFEGNVSATLVERVHHKRLARPFSSLVSSGMEWKGQGDREIREETDPRPRTGRHPGEREGTRRGRRPQEGQRRERDCPGSWS